MLELNAAPSPNPVLPTANATAPADSAPAEGVGAEGSQGQSSMPFAAVLKQHLANVSDKKVHKVVEALLAAAQQPAAAAASDTPADPIALLAPMLAGIAVPQAKQAKQADIVDLPSTDVAQTEVADTAVAIAAPITPAAENNKAVPGQMPAQTGRTVDNLPHDTEKPLPASANIAAPALAASNGKPSGDGQAGDAQAGFDALLSQATEAQATATPHMPGRAPQAATPAPASTPVATPVGAPGWDREIGDKVVWMVGRQETKAELVLNPPNLGRVEVSVTMNGDQANAVFTSANASVREALENAMPRLREILQGAGISLGQTQVGAESFQQAADRQESGHNSGRGRERDTEAMPNGLALGENTAARWLQRGDGMVDTFA